MCSLGVQRPFPCPSQGLVHFYSSRILTKTSLCSDACSDCTSPASFLCPWPGHLLSLHTLVPALLALYPHTQTLSPSSGSGPWCVSLAFTTGPLFLLQHCSELISEYSLESVRGLPASGQQKGPQTLLKPLSVADPTQATG